MSPLREPALREAIAGAERHVAALRVAVAIARRAADPVLYRRRSIACLVVIGAAGLVGSVAWGRHLTREASAVEDRRVGIARDEEILVNRRAFDACSTAQGEIATRLAECTREVAALAPYARTRLADTCECMFGDPLCGCR